MNSSSEINPSWSWSAAAIISSKSFSSKSNPNYLAFLLKLFIVMNPVFSSSNNVNRYLRFSLESLSTNRLVFRWRNWSNVIFPEPSLSKSQINWYIPLFLTSAPLCEMISLISTLKMMYFWHWLCQSSEYRTCRNFPWLR